MQCRQGGRGKPKTRHPSFAECLHPLLSEWDHERNENAGLLPENVRLGSNKLVHWLCRKCPLGHQHAWQAKPSVRVAGRKLGCPFCSGHSACQCNSLQTHFPTIAAEWDYDTNNCTPNDFACTSQSLVWWHNEKKGSWQQRISWRTQNYQKTEERRRRKQLACSHSTTGELRLEFTG